MTATYDEFPNLSAPPPGVVALWAVGHPGIGVLPYVGEREARVASGTAGEVLTRDSADQPWREVA